MFNNKSLEVNICIHNEYFSNLKQNGAIYISTKASLRRALCFPDFKPNLTFHIGTFKRM